MSEIEFVTRYGKGPGPDVATMCEGQCEGLGIYPEPKDTLNAEACGSPEGRLLVIGQKGKDGKPGEEDGYVFVQCPTCKGTGKKA